MGCESTDAPGVVSPPKCTARTAFGATTPSVMPPSPPSATLCTPTTPHDDNVEGCYDWCPNNIGVNCFRCKCRGCLECAVTLHPGLLPPIPPLPIATTVPPARQPALLALQRFQPPSPSPRLSQSELPFEVLLLSVLVGALSASCLVLAYACYCSKARSIRRRLQPAGHMGLPVEVSAKQELAGSEDESESEEEAPTPEGERERKVGAEANATSPVPTPEPRPGEMRTFEARLVRKPVTSGLKADGEFDLDQVAASSKGGSPASGSPASESPAPGYRI